ncbi:thioredoxin [Altererythrobacter salegens]|uniref:Thioredoxin n=1 Tax=Croceibacterium salegens TaxID=1737568 RepID=A0A6I4T1J3_9SPHN|nr:aryl-sulfate sulfotransferase [Croceibacterium salegens]MXO60512.1 thioredoxin [Croceibacterium salegens]
MSIALTRRGFAGGLVGMAGLAAAPGWAAPTVFPTGTTIFDPAKTWSGFTVLSLLDTRAVVVLDMNGRTVKRWDDFDVFSGGPARVLPGGIVVAPQGAVQGHLEANALVARDFDGKELWRRDDTTTIERDGKAVPSARQHHDWQLDSFPAGYYSPGVAPSLEGSRKLLLTHESAKNPAIADVILDDDRLIVLGPDGKLEWEWQASKHIDALGFGAPARAAIRRLAARDNFDWFHINAATWLGPNKWFDTGDDRFDPGNVIISSRATSIIAIVRPSGEIAWQIGPDFGASPELMKIGQIIGQHHAHLIPKGLPGAGNLLVFDNGGYSGYGDVSGTSARGDSIYQRAGSRVLEIDPVSLELVWSYSAPNFYSFNISGAQRLPNGNTLITEGAPGRIFEVTAEKDIVWEFMNPPGEGPRHSNTVYRAYRIPYGWMPQVAPPAEVPIVAPEGGTFHVPGTPG